MTGLGSKYPGTLTSDRDPGPGDTTIDTKGGVLLLRGEPRGIQSLWGVKWFGDFLGPEPVETKFVEPLPDAGRDGASLEVFD